MKRSNKLMIGLAIGTGLTVGAFAQSPATPAAPAAATVAPVAKD